jgi:hypothetical protein
MYELPWYVVLPVFFVAGWGLADMVKFVRALFK